MTNGNSPFQISNTPNISNKCTSTHRPFAWFCIDYHQIKWRIKVNIISNDYPPYCLCNSDYIWMISFKLFHVNAPVVYNLSVRWPQREMVFASLVYYLSHVHFLWPTERLDVFACLENLSIGIFSLNSMVMASSSFIFILESILKGIDAFCSCFYFIVISFVL